MSAFGRWWSGRRSEQHPTSGRNGAGATPEEAVGAAGGSTGDVELGPAPPPDAAVNQGPPTGPLPVPGRPSAPRPSPPPATSTPAPSPDAAPDAETDAEARTVDPPWRRPTHAATAGPSTTDASAPVEAEGGSATPPEASVVPAPGSGADMTSPRDRPGDTPTVPSASVPPGLGVPPTVAEDDRDAEAAGPPDPTELDAPVHADLGVPTDVKRAAPEPPAPEPTTPEPTAPGPTTPGRPGRPGHATVGAPSPPDVPVDLDRLAQGRLGIDEVTPEVSGGRFPSKAVVGEVVPVTASVWREGHDGVAASLVWQRCPDASHAETAADLRHVRPCGDTGAVREVRMVSAGPQTDRFVGTIVPDVEGLWTFRVDAWGDPWATWRHAVEVKEAAGQGPAELANDLESGARLLERAATAVRDRFRTGPTAGPTTGPTTGSSDAADADLADGRTTPVAMPPALAIAQTLDLAAAALRDDTASLPARLGPALAPAVHRTMTEQPVRELVTRGETHHVLVERARALDGAWYEFFPRSTGGVDAEGRPVHGTFATSVRELERVAAMGFDVAYLPPIHPVGTVNRKGPNNTLTPGPDDVGSPWAIGSAAGGHDAVDPALGTLADFDAFVARAHELGLEIALDFALQCAPDHPWAAEHPEWFTLRPDGTITYAENPPKKYQDIYPVNFDVDPEGIYRECLRVLLGWLEHGVRIFRVDNPHTKPPDFWAWLIAEVHRVDPGVVFLAEAFTRPARLFGLARLGFSQSYTYFTWRTGKEELQEFFELHRDRIDECRPNCFVNTPDILHESLQVGGPGMFALRAALAATLSPSWGVYAGFELFEGRAVRPDSEEYLDSEKYQLRPRDPEGALAAGRSLEPWITRLNELRRAHPALRQLRTLRFHHVDNPALLAFSKTDPRSGDAVICVITLNPVDAEQGTLRLDLDALGLDPAERFAAVDEVSGQTFDWGHTNFVRLEPWRDVAHVVSVLRR